MGYCVGDGIDVRPLGAELFVDESRRITELFEDGCEGWAVLYCGLGFDADFVPRAVRWLIAWTFVCKGPSGAVVAEKKKLTLGPEVAGRSVVECVVLEGAGSVEVE